MFVSGVVTHSMGAPLVLNVFLRDPQDGSSGASGSAGTHGTGGHRTYRTWGGSGSKVLL